MEKNQATPNKNYTPEQFNKLPKWAQHELNRLEKNVAYHKKRADVVTSNEDLSNTRIRSYEDVNFNGWRNLPNNESISFFPKENSDARFDVKVDGFGRIEIYANSGFPNKMVVLPLASNIVAIEMI